MKEGGTHHTIFAVDKVCHGRRYVHVRLESRDARNRFIPGRK